MFPFCPCLLTPPSSTTVHTCCTVELTPYPTLHSQCILAVLCICPVHTPAVLAIYPVPHPVPQTHTGCAVLHMHTCCSGS